MSVLDDGVRRRALGPLCFEELAESSSRALPLADPGVSGRLRRPGGFSAGTRQPVGPLVARVDVLDHDLHDAAVVERVALAHRRPLVFASLDADVGAIWGPAQRVVEGEEDVPRYRSCRRAAVRPVDRVALEEAKVADVVGGPVVARVPVSRALRSGRGRAREDRVEGDLAPARALPEDAERPAVAVGELEPRSRRRRSRDQWRSRRTDRATGGRAAQSARVSARATIGSSLAPPRHRSRRSRRARRRSRPRLQAVITGSIASIVRSTSGPQAS